MTARTLTIPTLLATVFAAVCLPAAAMQFSRVETGPDSANVQRVDSDTDGTLLIATGSRVHLSSDGGQTWAPAPGQPPSRVRAVAADGGSYFALTDVGVYASVNAGQNWALFNGDGETALPAPEFGSSILEVANGFVLVTNQTEPNFNAPTGVYRSATDVAAWTDVTPPGTARFTDLRAAGNNLCLLVLNNGMRFSTDNGDSWQTTSGLNGSFTALDVSPDGTKAVVATSGRLANSTNQCGSFGNAGNNGIDTSGNSIFAAGVANDGTLYAGQQNGELFVRPAGEFTFSAINSGTLPAATGTRIGAIRAAGSELLIGTAGGGVHTDSSGTFARVSGPTASGIFDLAAGPSTGDIGIALNGGGYASTTDGGATFTLANAPQLRSANSVYRDGDLVLVSTNGIFKQDFSTSPATVTGTTGMFRSTDSGVTFTEVTAGLPTGASMAGFASDGAALYSSLSGSANFNDRAVYKSTDGGQSWSKIEGSNGGFVTLASGDGFILNGHGSGLQRIRADGSIENAAAGLPGSQIKVYRAGDTGTYIATNSNAVFRTDNGSSGTFTQATGFAISRFGVNGLALARDADGVLYLGDEHAGLSVSTDDGLTWTPDSDGLPLGGVCVSRQQALLVDGGTLVVGDGEGNGLLTAPVLGDQTPGDSVDCTTDVDIFVSAFSFQRQDNVPPATVVTSNTVSISGIAAPVGISVSGGEYSVGCDGNFTTDAGTIENGQSVCVRHTSSDKGETEVSTMLTVGDQSATFSSLTGLIFNGGDDEINTGFGDNGIATAPTVGNVPRANVGVIDPDGNVVMGGLTTEGGFGSPVRLTLARLTAEGQPDSAFGDSGSSIIDLPGNAEVVKLLRQADGKYLMIGWVLNKNGTTNTTQDDFGQVVVGRFNADGTVDTAYGTDGLLLVDINPNEPGRLELVGDAAMDATGAAIIGGGVVTGGSGTHFFAVRVLTDGNLDTDFGGDSALFADGVANIPSGGSISISAGGLAIDSQGRIVMAGRFQPNFSTIGALVTRMTPAGIADTGFSEDGKLQLLDASQLNDVLILPNDLVLVAGEVRDPGDRRARPALARISAGGELDSGLGTDGLLSLPDVEGSFKSLLLRGDGKIAASGTGIAPPASGTAPKLLYVVFDASLNLQSDFGEGGIVLRGPIGSAEVGSEEMLERADGGVVHVYGGYNALVFGGGDGGNTGGNDDTTPDAFTFIDVNDVEPTTEQTSNAITVAGIDAAAQITVTGGEYSIGCSTTFTSAAGTINNGESVCVQHTASADFGGMTDTTLAIGGVSDTFTSTVRAADVMPDAFTFLDQADVAQSTVITSNTVTINGIDDGAAISIDVGEYSIGCDMGGFTATAGAINNGQMVCVRHTSADAPNSAVNSVLTIGTVSDTFTTTTAAETGTGDTTPDAFTFVDQANVAKATVIQSNVITVAGIDAASAVSVTGGDYSIGCTAAMFTANPGVVNNGDTVCLRHTSASTDATAVDTVLTIGGVSDTFTSTTAAAQTGGDEQTVTDANGNPVPVSSSAGTIENLTNTPNPPAGSNPPASVSFPNGVFGFDVTGLTPGDSVVMTITLPAGATPDTYYKFQNGGSFEFLRGAGDEEGAVINGNVITLTLIDGGLGDADGVANGTISDPGAPGVTAATPPQPGGPQPVNVTVSDSGSLGWWMLGGLGLLGLRRRRLLA